MPAGAVTAVCAPAEVRVDQRTPAQSDYGPAASTTRR